MLFFTSLRIRLQLLPIALAITLVIAVFITACSQQNVISNSQTVVPSVSSSARLSTSLTQLNQPFQLKIQQIAEIESENLQIQFLEVSDDSRCPVDVQCFWAGQATIVIGILKDGNNLGNVNLVLGAASPDQATAHFDNYTISLLELTPYPQQNQQVERLDYTATLLVSR